MIDPISSAAGKLDDPLMLEWAVGYYDDLPAHAKEVRTRVESAWFHDVILARLIEQEAFDVLTTLFRQLPPRHFANLSQRILERWSDWPGTLAGRALPALAANAPEALFELLEDYLERAEQGPAIDPERFRDLPCLRVAGFRERRMALLERVARCALALPKADFRRDLLLSGLLAEADALSLETLESVLAGGLRAESRGHARDSMLEQLFRGLFGGSEYLDLVFARARDEATQELAALAPLFSPLAPLERLDAWLAEAPALAEILPALAAAAPDCKGAEILHRLLSGSALEGLLAENELARLAVAGCIHSHALADFDAAALDLPTTIDLLAADLDDPRWTRTLCARLAQFPKAETAPRLTERLPAVNRTYGGVQIASAMGSLGWDEFAPCLIEALGEDQPDFLCDAAKTALVGIGAAARDALIARWDGLDGSQRIYGLSVISEVGGPAATDFALIRFDELLEDFEESFCELALAAPDPRVLDKLRPELRRKQMLIDRAYALLARLLDREDDDSRMAHERALADFERSIQIRNNLQLGDFSRDGLFLSLRCPECGGVNTYDVAGVILPGQGQSELPYLVEDEFPCASCGAWVEFEFTPKAMLAVTAEAMFSGAAGQSGQDRHPFIRALNCRIDGQVMPVAAALKRLRERANVNAKDGAAWYHIGVLSEAIHRPRAALAAYEEAAAALPAAVTATLQQAELLAGSGRSEEALNLLAAAWTRREEWQIFGDPRTVQREFIDLFNRLRRELGRTDLPALHPSAIPETRKVGRNDPCPCGSGKKFKKCCGK